jgi:hypothetical protein
MLQRGRHAFEEEHGAPGGYNWIVSGGRLDLADGSPGTRDRRLRLPAEGAAAEATRELRASGSSLRHRPPRRCFISPSTPFVLFRAELFLDRHDDIRTALAEPLEVQVLDELGQGRFPRLLPVVVEILLSESQFLHHSAFLRSSGHARSSAGKCTSSHATISSNAKTDKAEGAIPAASRQRKSNKRQALGNKLLAIFLRSALALFWQPSERRIPMDDVDPLDGPGIASARLCGVLCLRQPGLFPIQPAPDTKRQKQSSSLVANEPAFEAATRAHPGPEL